MWTEFGEDQFATLKIVIQVYAHGETPVPVISAAVVALFPAVGDIMALTGHNPETFKAVGMVVKATRYRRHQALYQASVQVTVEFRVGQGLFLMPAELPVCMPDPGAMLVISCGPVLAVLSPVRDQLLAQFAVDDIRHHEHWSRLCYQAGSVIRYVLVKGEGSVHLSVCLLDE